jgi:hypothetical protein
MALNRIQTDGIEDDAITTAKILDGTVGPADIGDGELTNTQINASAAIALTKISGLGTAATLDYGTGANQIVQLDGTGKLPAVNASALTNLDAGDLTPSGTLPALNASNLTNLTAANLTGALPQISGANLTGVTTDTSAMENNIAILAFKVQSANNLAKFNLVDQVVDEYYDTTGIDSGASSGAGFAGSGIAKYYSGQVAANTTFAYTGSNQTWTAPSGITSITLKLWGAGGGGGSSANSSYSGGAGGGGGFITATTTVTPAQVYSILVGQSKDTVDGVSASPYTNAYGGGGNGGGSNAANQRVGGTGGGRTEFSIGGGANVPAGTRIIVASGGGGGAAVYDVSSQPGGNGGFGGGTTGGSGTGDGTPPTGGTQSAGGSVGSGTGGYGAAAVAGSAGIGGGAQGSNVAEDTGFGSGGGGGGGFYGGAGGDSSYVNENAHGGGGGSSYANPSYCSSITNTAGSIGSGSTGGATGNSSDADYTSTVGVGGTGVNTNSGAGANGGDGSLVLSYTVTNNLTLQSLTNTALTSPTTGDIVMLIENAGSGAAVLGTNIKVFVSRNGGAAWDEATGSYALADKGTWGSGTKKIITANGIPFTGAAGTDMRYKITTHAQNAGTMETRVHATSLAWA